MEFFSSLETAEGKGQSVAGDTGAQLDQHLRVQDRFSNFLFKEGGGKRFPSFFLGWATSVRPWSSLSPPAQAQPGLGTEGGAGGDGPRRGRPRRVHGHGPARGPAAAAHGDQRLPGHPRVPGHPARRRRVQRGRGGHAPRRCPQPPGAAHGSARRPLPGRELHPRHLDRDLQPHDSVPWLHGHPPALCPPLPGPPDGLQHHRPALGQLHSSRHRPAPEPVRATEPGPGPDPRARLPGYIYGQTLVPEVEGGPRPTVHMLWTPIPQSLTLGGEERERCWEFLAAVAGSEEEAKRSYSAGLALVAAGSLHRSHIRAWAALRRGCSVELDGPPALRQALHGCLYYLLSAVPPQDSPGVPFHGISPGGLSNGTRGEDYWGHVFWDQDTWVFPNILLLYPAAARAVLQYRLRTLEGARRNAQEQGYEGAKFPWESAATGREVCPEEIYGAQEIHVSGDVLMAFEQYYCTTQDQQLFREDGGWELVEAVAQYWCSRMEWSEEEQLYHIRGVMPPDEYHSQVNNSAFTNAVARRSLNFAADLARDLLLPVPEEWQDRARKIKVPFDEERKYHPEYDGYSPGEPVKQADVVLLGFPLMHPMSAEVRRNDLEMYEPVTDPAGPAMTWSMFAVGWLELKELQRARSQLQKCFSNITEPFKVWVENSDGSGAVNFLTGMGGFLQVVLFGFTGFRITRSGLLFDPAFPDDITKLNISGVSYLGNKLGVTITREETRMEVTETCRDPPASALEAVLESGQRFPLREGQSISFPTAPGWIQRSPGRTP